MTALADSPDVAAAKRLLDAAKTTGFVFQRMAPGGAAPAWWSRVVCRSPTERPGTR
ncbi:MAG: hypothetical protein ACRDSH_01910 [Pseudonocardiaceae bacterium]